MDILLDLYKVDNKKRPNFYTEGFDKEDGILLLHTSLPLFQAMIDAGKNKQKADIPLSA